MRMSRTLKPNNLFIFQLVVVNIGGGRHPLHPVMDSIVKKPLIERAHAAHPKFVKGANQVQRPSRRRIECDMSDRRPQTISGNTKNFPSSPTQKPPSLIHFSQA